MSLRASFRRHASLSVSAHVATRMYVGQHKRRFQTYLHATAMAKSDPPKSHILTLFAPDLHRIPKSTLTKSPIRNPIRLIPIFFEIYSFCDTLEADQELFTS